MPDLTTFEKALEISKDKANRTVLLGNGFSIAQNGTRFTYKNLLQKSGLDENSSIRKVFAALQTFDFESVVIALESAAIIETAYGDKDRSKQFSDDATKVRDALIHAVREVHPGVHFDLPEPQRKACGTFLKNFETVFTLNYDLLLYCVIVESQSHSDGFGLGEEKNGFRTFQTGANCSLYYLHGALHLFLDDLSATQKRILNGTTIIGDITETIRGGRLPLFVAEGSTLQKVHKIFSVPYLKHCYEMLQSIKGNLFIFGHSLDENDSHIYDAICRSKEIKKLFFCVHKPVDNLKAIEEKLAKYKVRRKDIEFFYIDAALVKVWG